MRKFSINLKPEAPEVPDIDEMAAQEIPVHAMEVLDAATLERRAKSELVEAREKAVRKIKDRIELENIYARYSET